MSRYPLKSPEHAVLRTVQAAERTDWSMSGVKTYKTSGSFHGKRCCVQDKNPRRLRPKQPHAHSDRSVGALLSGTAAAGQAGDLDCT